MSLLWLMPQQASALFLDRPQCTAPRALSSKKPLNLPLSFPSRIDAHKWRTGYGCKCELPWSLLVAYSPASTRLLVPYIRQGCKGRAEANRLAWHKKKRGLLGGCPCLSSNAVMRASPAAGISVSAYHCWKGRLVL